MSDFFESLRISASALHAERERMGVISSNLANAQTTRAEDGGPYRRKDIVFSAEPTSSFSSLIQQGTTDPLHEVKVVDVILDPRPARLIYEPHHPHANREGYVAYPNVNTTEEMVNMITASRSFEANVTAISVARNMMNKALEIGRR